MKIGTLLVLALGLTAGACAADPLPGYHAAPPEERAALVQVVREYYQVLDRAQTTGDIGPLYALHPSLAVGEDRRTGVNFESFTVERARAAKAANVRTEPESAEPMRAFVKGDTAVVYVHGLFTWTYANWSETKGELFVRIDLARDGARWTIVRSDERLLSETPAPTPR